VTVHTAGGARISAWLGPDARPRRRAQEGVRQELVQTGEHLIRAQAARDRNALRLQQLAAGGAAAGAGAPGEPVAGGAAGAGGGSFDKENDAPGGGAAGAGEDEEPSDLIQGYLTRISRLEKEVRRLRQARPRNPSHGVSARGARAPTWCGL